MRSALLVSDDSSKRSYYGILVETVVAMVTVLVRTLMRKKDYSFSDAGVSPYQAAFN